MPDLGIACSVCKWFLELTDSELKGMAKHGYVEWAYWCKYEPGLYVIETLPANYCQKFECICGGSYDDNIDHRDCIEVEFELE
jgi:hypothetical protein